MSQPCAARPFITLDRMHGTYPAIPAKSNSAYPLVFLSNLKSKNLKFSIHFPLT